MIQKFFHELSGNRSGKSAGGTAVFQDDSERNPWSISRHESSKPGMISPTAGFCRARLAGDDQGTPVGTGRGRVGASAGAVGDHVAQRPA